MNPQNAGEHITLRHSSLWKKPLLYEKNTKQHRSQAYHKQMNQLAMKGFGWRYRDLDQTELGYKWAVQQQQKKAQSRTRCPSASRVSTDSQIIQDETMRRSQMLVDGMKTLSESKQLEARNFTKAYYDAVGKSPFVLNDYHRFPSNPSFSRNVKGKFYTR